MRRFVGLATVLGVFGIAGGSQVAGAAQSTDPAVKLCKKEKGTYATFFDPVTFQGGYTCTRTAPFTPKQVTAQNNVCAAEGGLNFGVSGDVAECIQRE
jgi:hypothetical protein